MKQFIPTYLYVKTHNVTGLKYFGKTTGDPHKYRGSGIYWLRHIKEHGYDVTTEVIGYYLDKDECVSAALLFSTENNIVGAVNEHNKKIWANQIIENGTDGGATGRTNYKPHSAESRAKMSLTRKGRTPWNKGKVGVQVSANKGKVLSEETKQKLREANLGKKQSAESVAKRSTKLKGHTVTEETRKKISEKNKGRIVSEEQKQKMRAVKRTEEQKQHLRNINLGKVASEETKQKLSGKVVVVDKQGNKLRIDKDVYYAQTGPKEEWEWIMHRAREAQARLK